jgi:hypothetical protein
MKIGGIQLNYPVSLSAGTWHHLAVVRRNMTVRLHLDGHPIGSTFNLSRRGLPVGTLRVGKTKFDNVIDGGGAQFYGFIDDLAIFKKALPNPRIAQLATSLHLSGTEQDLYAGYTFGYVPAGGISPKLARPIVRTPGTNIHQTSPDRNKIIDAVLLEALLIRHPSYTGYTSYSVDTGYASYASQSSYTSTTNVMDMPLPLGEEWQVIQGYDNPTYTHNGYASFCLDLRLARVPQMESNGRPFYSAGPGAVDFIKQDESSGGLSNFISVKQDQHEFSDYLHLSRNSAQVKVGDSDLCHRHLADVGDTGAEIGAYHLHIAVTNLGEAHKNSGGTFVTIPAAISNYEASIDGGRNWIHFARGIPLQGQWVRRADSMCALNWTLAGNTTGQGANQPDFGQVGDGRPIWIGDFNGDGRQDVLFYFPGDGNWWLGSFTNFECRMIWKLAGNTNGFDQVGDGRPIWIGDFNGDGRQDVLFYFPGDGNWWLGKSAAVAT